MNKIPIQPHFYGCIRAKRFYEYFIYVDAPFFHFLSLRNHWRVVCIVALFIQFVRGIFKLFNTFYLVF